jgi:hypothetical protein
MKPYFRRAADNVSQPFRERFRFSKFAGECPISTIIDETPLLANKDRSPAFQEFQAPEKRGSMIVLPLASM